MKRVHVIIPVLCLLLPASLAFAGGSKDRIAADAGKTATKPKIAVSILPHAYFVRRIGGELISTLVLVGPGQDPHSYEPSPRQMEELSSAKAWLLSGTDFEIAFKPKIASIFPALTMVDGTDGVEFRSMEAHGHEGEEHEEGEVHGMEIDRHTWLGRKPAKIFADHVFKTLSAVAPENTAIFEANHQSLIADIDREFDALIPILSPLKGKPVFVFHPAFGYFLDEFGIVQEAVETGGKEPTAKALAALIEEAKADDAKVIFVQSQFPVNAAKTVANAVGATVAPLDPLAEDWLANIKVMGEALKKASR